MEDELIQRAQAGDHAAFRVLVDRYAVLTSRTARVLLADRAAAEDAVQDAWLDAWRNLHRFQAGRPLRPWLLTLVSNRCRMAARRRLPPSVTLDGAAEDQLVDPADVAGEVVSASLDVELATALSKLPSEQQRVVELRFFADLELAEIATVTGAQLGTVKSRLHRALANLQARLLQDQTPALATLQREESAWQH